MKPWFLLRSFMTMLIAVLLLCGISLTISARRSAVNIRLGSASEAVTDLSFEYFGPGYHLVWTYSNTGDYDQNGEVNIADLTPIGTYFGAADGDADWAQAQVADGDGNGEVNISDITPIGNNFGSYAEGYRIYSGDTNTGPWNLLAEITVAEAKEELIIDPLAPSGGPVVFIYLLGATMDALHYYVVPYAGVAEGAASEVLSFSTDPAGVSAVEPISGFAGDLIEFNAETSGQLLTYAWDFGGGAVPDTSSFPRPWVNLGDPGDYAATVTVDNEFGDPVEFAFTLSVVERTGEVASIVTVQPFGGIAGSQVAFNAQVTGTPSFIYAWDFGGGASPNTSSAASPNVTLGVAGFYLSKLTVSNDHGPDVEFQFMLTVE